MLAENTTPIDVLANSFVTILISGGFSVVLTLAVVWLARNWIGERIKGAIKNEYDEKLESHKAQLKAANDFELEKLKAQLAATNDTELERLKAELHIAASERNIKLTKIFEQQAEIAATTHSNLITFFGAFQRATETLGVETGETPTRKQALQQAYDKLQNEYQPKQIYIPRELRTKINNFIADTYKVMGQINMLESFQRLARKNDQTMGKIGETIDQLTAQLPKLLDELDADFERLLGVDKK
jgi:hypothetical protein